MRRYEIHLETLALFLLALLAWLLLVVPSRAGWGPSGCAAVAAPALRFQAEPFAPQQPPPFWPAPHAHPAPLPEATLAWESDGDGGHALYRGDTQVGWMTKKGVYYPRHGKGVWGKAGEPPVARPAGFASPEKCCKAGKCDCDPADCQCGKTKGLCCDGCTCAVVGQATPAAPSWQTSGVETDKIGRRDKVTLNGHEIDKRRAIEVLTKGVPDDGKLPKLTVIGQKADRDRVTKDLDTHPALAPFKGKFAVQSYDPGDPMLKGLKFPDGSPSIVIQRADRAVIGRNLSGKYAGPEELAQALPGALRRADPDYDPMKDPDLIKPVPVPIPVPVPAPSPSLPDLSKVPPVGWLVGGVGALVLLLSVTRRTQ